MAWFRYFDAEAGRWCSPDPLGFWGGKNLQAFGPNATAKFDPYGLSCPQGRLQDATDAAYAKLLGDMGALRERLHPAEREAIRNADGPWLARMFFGSALEREMAQKLKGDVDLEHNTGAGPDFVDPKTGEIYDVTTDNPRTMRTHERRHDNNPHLYPTVPNLITYPSLDNDEAVNIWKNI